MQNEIIHTVSFTLKYPKGAPESNVFLDTAVEMLADISGVNDFTVLEQVSEKCEFQYHFSMRFANQVAYDAYNTHPNHVKFVSEYWMKEVDDFMEQDYVKL